MDDKQIYADVMAGFTSQQTSLHKWCKENGYKSQNARKALLGIWKGKKGLAFRQLLIEKSGADCRQSKEVLATILATQNTSVANISNCN